jgi:hypothetical protein
MLVGGDDVTTGANCACIVDAVKTITMIAAKPLFLFIETGN